VRACIEIAFRGRFRKDILVAIKISSLSRHCAVGNCDFMQPAAQARFAAARVFDAKYALRAAQ
jgi:hypothetical protein